MIETGDAIVILGVLGTIITAIIRFIPSKRDTNGNFHVTKEACELKHEGIETLRLEQFDRINEKLSDTGTRLKAVEDNTFEILRKMGS